MLSPSRPSTCLCVFSWMWLFRTVPLHASGFWRLWLAWWVEGGRGRAVVFSVRCCVSGNRMGMDREGQQGSCSHGGGVCEGGREVSIADSVIEPECIRDWLCQIHGRKAIPYVYPPCPLLLDLSLGSFSASPPNITLISCPCLHTLPHSLLQPYFSYLTMLHLYESLGWWRAGSDLRKVHFYEENNEHTHLQVRIVEREESWGRGRGCQGLSTGSGACTCSSHRPNDPHHSSCLPKGLIGGDLGV